MSVVVRVMGPLEVISHDRPVVVPGGKERGLLVLLALQSGRVVPSERLIEALWDGEPPPSAETSLRVLVSRLRKTLSQAGAGRSIITRSPGYVLDVDEVDLAAFDALCLQGHHELADRRFAAASATLTQALALWRGERLAQTDSRYLQGESDRFAEIRLTAAERGSKGSCAAAHADVLGDLSSAPPTRCAKGSGRSGSGRITSAAGRPTLCRPTRTFGRLWAPSWASTPARHYGGWRRWCSPRNRAWNPRSCHHPPTCAISLPPWTSVSELPSPAGAPSCMHWKRLGPGPAPGDRQWCWCPATPASARERLLREFARIVQHGEIIILHGRCDPDLAIPYQPFVECMSEAVAASSDGVLADLTAPKLAELARMVPDLASRRHDLPSPAKADPDVERHLLFGAAASLLIALARTAPGAARPGRSSLG